MLVLLLFIWLDFGGLIFLGVVLFVGLWLAWFAVSLGEFYVGFGFEIVVVW